MKNVSIICCGILIIFSCVRNSDNEYKFISKNKLGNVELDTNMIQLKEIILTKYIDSLNVLTEKDSLPHFLFEKLDQNAFFWPDFHHPISVRNMVIDKVTNKNTLERILSINHPALIAVIQDSTIPYYNITTQEMVRMRLDLLKDLD